MFCIALLSVSAFLSDDRIVRAIAPSSSSSLSILSSTFHYYAKVDDNTDGVGSSTTEHKLIIPTITDVNSATLLNPTHNRPVLVDAFAPWCGPCKLLDKVLRKSQPQYLGKVDFCRWNVNDADGTEQLRTQFLEAGYALTKLPSLIVYRGGKPVAVRPGFANEYQLDDFLEKILPDVLERTFDEHGVKLTPDEVAAAKRVTFPMTTVVAMEEACLEATEVGHEIVIVETECVAAEESTFAVVASTHEEEVAEPTLEDEELVPDCKSPQECFDRLEQTIWKNRRVVPAMDGIGTFLPERVRTKSRT